MNERTTLEIIAPTVEEALAQGLAQLGLPADAVSVEVLDAGNRGLFGLGGRQVRVRLTVHGPEEAAAPVEAPSPAPRPKAIEKPSPAPRASRARPKPQLQPVEEPKAEPAQPVPAAIEGHDELLDKTEALISKLLHMMKMQAQVSAHYAEQSSEDRRTIHVDIRGEDLGALIGRHAETLNAFQYVASLMVGKEAQQWVQLIVDVEVSKQPSDSYHLLPALGGLKLRDIQPPRLAKLLNDSAGRSQKTCLNLYLLLSAMFRKEEG